MCWVGASRETYRDRDKFWEPVASSNTRQPLEYSSQATAFAIPLFEALHRMAGNPEVNLRDDNLKELPPPSDGRPLAEYVQQFGVLCYTLYVLQEQATQNFNSDYNPHQTVVAGSDLLRELACLVPFPLEYALYRIFVSPVSHSRASRNPELEAAFQYQQIYLETVLAFQVEPYFTEPEELEAKAKQFLPERMPIIHPITASEFPEN